MTRINRQDADLHYPDGTHRATPSSTSGHQVSLWHHRLTRHLDSHGALAPDEVDEVQPTARRSMDVGAAIAARNRTRPYSERIRPTPDEVNEAET